jgi:hypothetical protein
LATTVDKRPERILKSGLGRPFRHDLGSETFRIHRLDRRRPDEVDIGLRKCSKIGRKCPRIGAEIFARRELRRVDEDRHDDAIGAALCSAHQRKMAGVQGAHGGHQRDGLAPCAQLGDGALERR